MIKISILYPNSKSARFDIRYYAEQHMPRSIALLSGHPRYRGISVERGLGGPVPGADPAYVAMCHFLFDSLESFSAAFSAHAEALQGDMTNYTDVEPIIQVSEVLISG